ncbi:putative pelota protein [Cryptosporidium serpentis]
MQIIRLKIIKDGFGFVKLKINCSDDIWELYNLIIPGDSVRSITYRKVYKEYSTGSSSVKVHRLMMTLLVKGCTYEGDCLRISGFNAVENEFVKVGQHHTVDIKVDGELILYKKSWDWLSKKKLMECSDESNVKKNDICILLMDNNGLANFYIATKTSIKHLFNVTHNISKKRGDNSYRDSKYNFFEKINNSLKQNLDLNNIDCIITAGPGFMKDDYLDYIKNTSLHKDKEFSKLIYNKKHIFLIAKASNANKPAVEELLSSEELQDRLKDTKAFIQVQILNKFQMYICNKPSMVCYGLNHVKKALENNAVDTLLLCDSLLRCFDASKRRFITNLAELNTNLGGKLYIYSENHFSGQQLQKLSGMAAILRFPMLEEEFGDEDNQVLDDINSYTNIDNEFASNYVISDGKKSFIEQIQNEIDEDSSYCEKLGNLKI